MRIVALVAVPALLLVLGSVGWVAPKTKPGVNASTVWVCRAGEDADPCLSSLATTVVGPAGTARVERLSPAKDPAVDCFYVYPTISGEATVNANLAVGFREREVAIAQASRFSQVCCVYAPAYRQVTLTALQHPRRITRANALIAYNSVLAAFQTYLAHYNHGRGIVFIGHSQGAAILIRLIESEVDGTPALRNRLVSALLLGGNVTVAKGSRTGGSFTHVPVCSSRRQTGCVVAYSSFAGQPPKNSQFGRTSSDAGVPLLASANPPANSRIVCVNPAALGGGTGRLDPAIPTLALSFLTVKALPSIATPWVELPGRYVARCESAGNATWLGVSSIGPAGRPLLRRFQDPGLGLHVFDVNIALDNLVALVRDQAAAYTRR